MKKKFISRTVVALLAAAMISASGSVTYAVSKDVDADSPTESSIEDAIAEPVVITVYDEYYDNDGNLIQRDTRQQDTIDKGSNYYYEAMSVDGYTPSGETVKNGIADSDMDIVFTYMTDKDAVNENSNDISEEDNTSSDVTPTKEAEDNTKSDVPENAPKSTKNTSKETNAKAPKTGDNFNMGLGVACIGGGLAAVGAGLYLSKKKRA